MHAHEKGCSVETRPLDYLFTLFSSLGNIFVIETEPNIVRMNTNYYVILVLVLWMLNTQVTTTTTTSGGTKCRQ